MKRPQLILKRRLSIFAELEKNERFASGFDFFLPAVNRFDCRQNIRAGCEPFGHEVIRNSLRGFVIRKRAQREKDFFRHSLGWDKRFAMPHRLGATDPTAADNAIVVINDSGLTGRDRALRFV